MSPTSSFPEARCRSPSPTRVRALKERGLARGRPSPWAPAWTATSPACPSPPRSRGPPAEGFAVAVCAIGPGIVGTGSALGHGGARRRGRGERRRRARRKADPRRPRSGADARARHRGVSHHTRAVLDLCLGDVVYAWPEGGTRRTGSAAGGGRRLRLAGSLRRAAAGAHGSRPDDDPSFFAAAYAAGRLARSRSRRLGRGSSRYRCAAVKIGVPREIKPDEYRIALTPAGARELLQRGHDVLVETAAGERERVSRRRIRGRRSARRRQRRGGVGGLRADPQGQGAGSAREYGLLRDDQILFTYLHLAANEPLTRALVESGAACVPTRRSRRTRARCRCSRR